MSRRERRPAAGFTYLTVLFAVALIGVTLAGAGTLWSVSAKREKEKELLFVGNEFRKAIRQYYERSPGTSGARKYPASLEVLVQDDRHANVVRHLRKIYVDPMTNSTEWGLVMSPLGGIVGVHSLSTGKPMKTGNFAERDKAFEGKETYAEWKFTTEPAQQAQAGTQGQAGTPAQPGTAGQPGTPGQAGTQPQPAPFSPGTVGTPVK